MLLEYGRCVPYGIITLLCRCLLRVLYPPLLLLYIFVVMWDIFYSVSWTHHQIARTTLSARALSILDAIPAPPPRGLL